MENGWKKIYFTGEEVTATIAHDLLAESGINSVIMNHKDSTYLSLGDIELYVEEKDEKEALKILAKLKKG
ncbi:MAG: DUF2007 domain-containing protein [Prolixibacteraceae bacterium]